MIRHKHQCQWRIQDFPGGCQPRNLEQRPIIWQDFCQKMHENESNWMRAPLDPPMSQNEAKIKNVA